MRRERLAELVAERQAPAALHRRAHRRPGDGARYGGVRSRCGRSPTQQLAQREFFLYIGRHVGLPVALEGALKLKEISYIATDAYAAGEMKHGPIALLDESTPVVVRRHRLARAGEDRLQHAGGPRARRARDRGRHRRQRARSPSYADAVITVPAVDWMLQPILAVIPLQLLAYEIARRRGLNVDQPRNLAKTVTVE